MANDYKLNSQYQNKYFDSSLKKSNPISQSQTTLIEIKQAYDDHVREQENYEYEEGESINLDLKALNKSQTLPKSPNVAQDEQHDEGEPDEMPILKARASLPTGAHGTQGRAVNANNTRNVQTSQSTMSKSVLSVGTPKQNPKRVYRAIDEQANIIESSSSPSKQQFPSYFRQGRVSAGMGSPSAYGSKQKFQSSFVKS